MREIEAGGGTVVDRGILVSRGRMTMMKGGRLWREGVR